MSCLGFGSLCKPSIGRNYGLLLLFLTPVVFRGFGSSEREGVADLPRGTHFQLHQGKHHRKALKS